MMRLALGFGLLLAACAPEQAPQTPADACGAAGLQGLVGQPRAAVDRMKLPEQTRIIPADSAITADLMPDRLNIELDPAGRVTKVSCF